VSELQAFEGWAVVEVMGHRVLAGYCDHVRVAGTEMLRVMIHGKTPGDPSEPHIMAAGSIFAVHPCSEEEVRARSTHLVVGRQYPQLCAYEGEGWDDSDDPGPDEGDDSDV
jgi:hypothetical protein